MATSQNGWTVSSNSANFTPFRWVTGRINKNIHIGIIFEDFCVWFNENIEPIRKDHSWAYAYRAIRGASSGYSNHASGTAFDLNAPKHPIGVRNTFSASDRAKIRKKLKQYNGALRWGGDYSGRPDDMHFEINTGVAGVKKVAEQITGKGSTAPVSNKKPVVINKPTPSTNKGSATIRAVQTALKKTGDYKGVIDGLNGDMTKNAVKSYQRRQLVNLTVDGVWGQKTKLHYIWTKTLQVALNRWKGEKLIVDGDFGKITVRRVRELQTRNKGGAYKGAVDGVVGSVFAKMVGIKAHPFA